MTLPAGGILLALYGISSLFKLIRTLTKYIRRFECSCNIYQIKFLKEHKIQIDFNKLFNKKETTCQSDLKSLDNTNKI